MPKASRDAFGKFLHDIGRTKLLTAEQEIALARRIQSGIAAESWEPSPERDAAISDGLKAKTYLVQANLRLVVSIAKKILPPDAAGRFGAGGDDRPASRR